MKRLILVIILAAIVLGYVDYNCVRDCLDKGYDYQLCTKMCSY